MGKVIDRYTRQDCNAILYQALKDTRKKINGGIYIDDERPDNSQQEDIVINTPSITIGAPGEMQTGYSNVNIYVPKITISDGRGSHYAYNTRSEDITKLVIEALEACKINGYLDIESENEQQSSGPEPREHFINIRVFWRLLKI